jgi:Fe-Mn family superoxide dismutase
MHVLPNLEYEYTSLEPFIDEQTMMIHHTKHHQTYIDKLNLALEKYSELQELSAEELIKNLNKIPEEIRTQVRNHGGGHFNHSMFWKLLKKDVKISNKFLNILKRDFGNFEKFKELFSKSANGLFGSGWCWLILNNERLEIINTQNQDNPISQGKIPILGIDLWEHAYWKLYINKKNEYVEAFYNVINWEQVEKNYENAIK